MTTTATAGIFRVFGSNAARVPLGGLFASVRAWAGHAQRTTYAAKQAFLAKFAPLGSHRRCGG